MLNNLPKEEEEPLGLGSQVPYTTLWLVYLLEPVT